MDEYDEINLGVVQVEYESQRERLNERPETISPATGKTSKIGCLWLIAIVWLIAGLFWAISEIVGTLVS